MLFSLSFLLVILLDVVVTVPRAEQVHLSFSGDLTSMAVTWITMEDDASTVFYGESPTNLPFTATGTKKDWYDGIHRFTHRALMTGLKPDTKYYYRITNRSFRFYTLPANPQSYKVCIFGDLGYWHGNSTESIIRNGLARKFDFIIHVGDISYDLHSNDGKTGDDFMNQLEPLVSSMPYMVIAGNHEDDTKNFSHYQNRFWMPENGHHDNQFYSVDIGPIHWVGVSTEYYGSYSRYGMEPVLNMYNWLLNDLKTANGNRGNVPWLMTYQHRPFYCSNINSAECKSFENRLIRTGWLDMPGLEPLFLKYGVDMGFWGHEHAYERNWPIADKTYWSGAQYMHNPPAPVYVLTGSAGCHTPDAVFGSPWPWSAVRNNDYGYSIMTVANSTHIHMEQISIDKNEAIVDDFWVSKDPSHVHTMAMRAKMEGTKIPNLNCPRSVPACRKSLKQLNEEL